MQFIFAHGLRVDVVIVVVEDFVEVDIVVEIEVDEL
jgi:hypothetical protein